MSPRALKVDAALGALPAVDDLFPLREALLAGARETGTRWSAAAAYATVDGRAADPEALEARAAELAEGVRARVEAVLRLSARALAALRDGDPAAAARLLIEAGEVEEDAGRGEAAEAFYRHALALGRKPRDRTAEGLALRRLARVARDGGRLDEAERLYRRGLEVAEASRETDGAVVACQGLGNVCVDQGRWDEAVRWYTRGVELLSGAPPSRLLWQLYVNLSVAARRAGDLDAGERWLAEAEAVIGALDDEAGRLPLENTRARLLLARGDAGAAEAAYRRSLAAAGPPGQRAVVLVNLAECLRIAGRLKEAEEVVRELERVVLLHGLTTLLPHVYRELGEVARARGDGEAFLFFEQALDLCRGGAGTPLDLAETQHAYARHERAQGNADAAEARLREALAVYEAAGARPEAERARRDLAGLTENPSSGADAT
jgi:tetratricopeptide (TPR) repeat protein